MCRDFSTSRDKSIGPDTIWPVTRIFGVNPEIYEALDTPILQVIDIKY